MAAYDLKSFLDTIGNYQVRTTNMFEMDINSGLIDVSPLQTITMYGQGIELPNRTTAFADVSFKGHPVPIPTVTTMGNEHSITVNADSGGIIRDTFLAWQRAVAAPDGFFGGNRSIKDYSNEVIHIHLLADNMVDVVENINIFGVRVGDVGPVQVSNVDASVATFTVSFRSIYWNREPGDAALTAGPPTPAISPLNA